MGEATSAWLRFRCQLPACPDHLSPRQMIKGTGQDAGGGFVIPRTIPSVTGGCFPTGSVVGGEGFAESCLAQDSANPPNFDPPIKVWRGAVAIRRRFGMICGLRRQ